MSGEHVELLVSETRRKDLQPATGDIQVKALTASNFFVESFKVLATICDESLCQRRRFQWTSQLARVIAISQARKRASDYRFRKD